MRRSGATRRLAAALLAATCLTPIIIATVAAPSWAEGGRGSGAAGGIGGPDSLNGPGGPGSPSIAGGGGGGGAGVTGGQGGQGASGAGGNGGLSAGANGQDGTGVSGGGGGAHGEVISLPGAIGAATGGSGGIGAGGIGGGGAGGYGAAITGPGAFTNSGIVRGGSGGRGAFGGSGGNGIAFGAAGSTLGNSGSISGGVGGLGSAGNGGVGGAGVSGTNFGIDNTGSISGGGGGEGVPGGNGGAGISGSGLTINNSVGATITGGVGGDAPESHAGDGGAGISSSSSTIINSGSIAGGAGGAFDGAGGTGISGSSTTVINSGSITGALGAGGRANAVTFTGGTNVLELRAGSTITGNVVAFSAADTFRLGGVGTASLDAGLIGPAAQFRNFGQFEKTGTGIWTLTGTASQTTPWTISQGTLAVNGSITGGVTVATAGTLGGNGTIFGSVTNNGALAPGNSIGTLTISGNYTQAAGSTYQVEVNAAGQGDRVNIGGAATIQGGTVRVLAQPGSYGQRTTYTILNATGGVTGTYSGVTSNYAFLSPSLSYDANDVYLTLLLQQNAFSNFSGNTPNQRAVGAALDRAFGTASGDFASVLGVMAGLDTVQGPRALTALSGEPWADFGTMNTNNSMLFMNAVGQQMAAARGTAGGGQRVAMAEACDTACDLGSHLGGRLSAWASGLGGLGSAIGDGNASTLTYNFGGVAVGADYRIDPRFLVGLAAGYTAGSLWVDGFTGRGWSDSVAVAAYGSFTQGALYADAQVGYAYFNNRLQRQIAISGLQPRTASGSTSANQVFGQVETGYKVGIFAPASATVTPFARLQAASVTQDGFTEWGADSLDLAMRAQTTNALRTAFGADLAGSIDIGEARTLDLRLRLGWQHEFADTGRPITAAFAGAPSAAFTVYGATPMRDSAVLGLEARTQIADATQLFLRYDGEIASGTDNHALNVGMRLTW